MTRKNPFKEVTLPAREGEIICITAGNYPSDVMRFIPGRNRCGDIHDGIGIEFGNGERGCFVLAFADLERVYKAAVIARNSHQ